MSGQTTLDLFNFMILHFVFIYKITNMTLDDIFPRQLSQNGAQTTVLLLHGKSQSSIQCPSLEDPLYLCRSK